MKTWKVLIKYSDENIENLDLYDASSYFDGYLKIKRSFFNSLIKAIKMSKKYTTGNAIEKVINPEGEDWTLNPWMLLLVKDNEKDNTFWYFIKRESDLSGLLVAIGPKAFADYINANTTETKRDIKRLINYLIAYLNKFNCIVLLPNYFK
ncbi:MAG: hypothetical protein ACFFD5_04375 [Candidatus Thorarchaeota archaeon]